jgi:hypothetical protein
MLHCDSNTVVEARPYRARWKTALTLAGAMALGSAVFADDRGHGRHDGQRDRHDRIGPDELRIESLSTKPHLVSGGDVLVRIHLARNFSLRHLSIELNGTNVADQFRSDAGGRSATGLLSGLRDGQNLLEVAAKGRHARKDRLILTSYPITGPIISGPHQQPFICQTQNFLLPDGTVLGPPADANCSAPTRVNYVYRSTAGGALRPMTDLARLPADVAMTTTTAGATVPFVVRVETGTMNRGVYQNVILHDPTSEPAPTPFSPPRGWNKRLIAGHGSGCPGGWYIQGAALGVNLLTGDNLTRLGEGYALFANTLNHPTNSCNPFLAGETTMMGKEHFIESFGVPAYTVSTGGSGGAYTSLQVADAFPGLFDGVLISSTFPDALSIALTGLDEHLSTRYFLVTNPTGFTDAQKLAVTGYKALRAWYDAALQSQRTDPVPGRVDPIPPNPILGGYNSAVWNPAVPVELRYDPAANPRGARPTVFDAARNIYGINPATGFALRPYDNTGVQFGLKALNDGIISPTQFLDLNERIGGYDQDANFVPARSLGSVAAIRRAYQSGVTLGGGGGLSKIPVFDISGLFDEDQLYHYQWFHFAVRERMKNENGTSSNHVVWRGGLSIAELLGAPTPEGAALARAVNEQSWAAFIDWVEAINRDRSRAPELVKVIRNKPAAAVDGCWTKELTPRFIAERQTWSSEPKTQCNVLWPSYSFARKGAGGPLDGNVLKCRLKPISPRDYRVSFSAAEWDRLHAVFPQGVCDWSRAGVAQTRVVEWASFGPSPKNLVFDVTAVQD